MSRLLEEVGTGVTLLGLDTGDLGVATQSVGLDDDGDPVARLS
ncbi:hypothetical protein ABTX24_03580 [Nocardioides sp. NPDC127514]